MLGEGAPMVGLSKRPGPEDAGGEELEISPSPSVCQDGWIKVGSVGGEHFRFKNPAEKPAHSRQNQCRESTLLRQRGGGGRKATPLPNVMFGHGQAMPQTELAARQNISLRWG